MRSQSVRHAAIFALILSLFSRLTTSAQNIVVSPLHTFTQVGGSSQAVSLTPGKTDGALYGTTHLDQTNGTVFTINPDGSGYNVLHVFGSQESIGHDPGTGISDPYVTQGSDGHLYGTTPAGGAFGFGTVFKLNANGSGYTIIHDFASITDSGPAALMQASDGFFYGAGSSIFKMDANGSNYSILYHFTNGLDGYDPLSPLLQGTDGALYGTTFAGGTNGYGTIFTIQTNSTGFKILHAFALGDGANPIGGLIQGSDGALYGTTSDSGPSGPDGSGGTIFKIDTSGNTFQVLHTFNAPPNDGAAILSGLVEGSKNILYGTTYLGGSSSFGVIFRIGLDGSNYLPLYYFTNSSPTGSQPITGLVKSQSQSDSGVFYGTTSRGNGGASGSGTIFAALINPPLTITPDISQTTSNQTILVWPKWAGTYSLQSTTNIASGNWVNVTDGVPVFGVKVTSTNPAMFYRLVSP